MSQDGKADGCCPQPGQKAESCSASPACCSTEAAAGQPASGKGPRTVAFVVVMLLAVGVAAHSLVTRSSDNPPGTARDPQATQEAQDASAAAPADVSGARPALLFSLDDFTFVILPAEDESANEKVVALAEATAAKIRDRDVAAGVVVADRGTALFDNTVQRVGVQDYPAVVAVAGDNCTIVVQRDITETALLRAYLQASAPSTCGPNSCAPTGDNTGSVPGP